jgi:Ca2+-binding RTX toxin-like protein
MENLQDADRFYYLSRTAGLNLLTQLEGNSFSELIQRNTDVQGLPADSFSRPGFVFDLAAQPASGAIVDDPATEYDERTMLVREPDGTIRYTGTEHVVFNGRDKDATGAGLSDRMRSSEGDDTLRGNDGNDRMEGGDGNDNLIGGLGDDIMTDLFGDDTLKGGDGDDAMSSGRGFAGDLNQGGRGNDFIVGGNDTTETFAGPGNDFVFAGDAEDTVFGDDGDDWIEGGQGPFNLLQGDNGAPFQDDPNEAGHDVMFSYGGEQDYDAEGGDDVMLLGPGIQRSEGMLGFDWTSHKSDPQAGNSDMRITGLLPPSVETNRDRFDLVESLSGWNANDTLRGDDRDEAAMRGHQLNAQGIARVSGLQGLLPAGATGFTGGNILLGGAGSDTIEGRGGDDLVDGDAWLNVQLQAPDLSTADPADVKRVDTMASLQPDVFAGRLDPGTSRSCGASSRARPAPPSTPPSTAERAASTPSPLRRVWSGSATWAARCATATTCCATSSSCASRVVRPSWSPTSCATTRPPAR